MLRHTFKTATVIGLLAIMLCSSMALAADAQDTFTKGLAQLEKEANGRLGAALVNVQTGQTLTYRAEERFPLCSTFKAVLAAAILKQSLLAPDLLDKRIHFSTKDLVTWSPITSQHLQNGLSISELAAAAVQYSDNTAANLLMQELGGPQAVTGFTRGLGDTVFSLERWEPELNSAIPGDTRDTSTPLDMARLLQKIAFGNALGPESRQIFICWLKGNTTGAESIRAGLPTDWVVGDKTGGGAYGTTNDIAIIWPTADQAFILTLYFTQPKKDAPARRDVLAAAARLAALAIQEQL